MRTRDRFWIIGCILWLLTACGTSPQPSLSNVTYATSIVPTVSATPIASPGTLTCVGGTLLIDGSSSLHRLMTDIVNKYRSDCPDAAISIGSNGSTRSLTRVENNLIDISVAAEGIIPRSITDLVDHKVAISVFAVVLNSKIGLTNLTTEQLKDVYGGKITNWNQLGGADLPVRFLCRFPTSGTRQAFEHYVLGDLKPQCTTANSFATGDMLSTEVIQHDGAIGYDILANARSKESELTVAHINGYGPETETVKQNAYPFWNVIHMFTKPVRSPLAQALIDYMTSESAQQILKEQGFIGVSDVSPELLNMHAR